MHEYSVGDRVSILCKDGKTFEGQLQDFDNECEVPWLLLNGCGYPMADIVSMDPA